MKEIIIDGVVYVPKEEKTNDLPFCIIRTFSAGVFAGYVKERNGKEGVLINSRRLWQWYGAKEICELAMLGIKKENYKNCRFSVVSDEIILTEIIEIQKCSDQAKKSIEEVPLWKQQ